MASTEPEQKVLQILRQWEEEHLSLNYDPTNHLQRLADVIELETENYYKMDLDPFDKRHPSCIDPECNFGQILKVLLRKDNFMTKLIHDYLRDTYFSRAEIIGKDVRKLNIAACRVMLDVLPGLETSAVFQPEMNDFVNRLFSWAEKSVEPLQSYSTGLLAAAMEVQEIATGFREQNFRMIPLVLQRLHELQQKAQEDRQQEVHEDRQIINTRPFAHFARDKNNVVDIDDTSDSTLKRKTSDKHRENGTTRGSKEFSSNDDDDSICCNFDDVPTSKKRKTDNTESTSVKNNELYPEITSPPLSVLKVANNSQVKSGCKSNLCSVSNETHLTAMEGNFNSSWAEVESCVIGNIQMYPLTLATRQMLILRYLTSVGDYQEVLGHVFERNALDLILKYINVRETKDSRLAFEAIKYLASLLCHKKFSIEFINVRGLQRLLNVPRPSVAATGVSMCLYYLAYCEDAMERVCLLPKHVISDLVTYALWLLKRSHDSGRCHATMFFGFSFSFKIILEEFDAQDGLRKLFNVISTLPILNIEENATINEDEECASKQIVRHVAVALKRYMEAHLHLKAEQLQSAENVRIKRTAWQPSIPPYKACKLSSKEVQAKIKILQKFMSVGSEWSPVEELYHLGGITLLLQIIAFVREWNFTERMMHITSSAETVRSCLDVIAICSVVPKVMSLLCERIYMPNMTMTTAINLFLAAAECKIIADADVQRAALRAIVNCVCAPMTRVEENVDSYDSKANHKESLQKVWECIRSNNGITVLLHLMTIKTPITDADSIRALACHALAGLARSEKVGYIISKLPMFINGQIQSLMKDPILQEKRQEHITFQKYALKVIEMVFGKERLFPRSGLFDVFAKTCVKYEVSLASLHKANVVARTKIQYNKQQLNQLIYQHLMLEGLTETANTLHTEANLDSAAAIMRSTTPYQSFVYTNPANPRNDFSSATLANLYNTSRCVPREAALNSCQNNTATSIEMTSSQFVSHTTNACSASLPSVNSNIRLKFADCASPSSFSKNLSQPMKLQTNQKKSMSIDRQSPVVAWTCQSTTQSTFKSLQKQISRDSGSGGGPGVVPTSNVCGVVVPNITLNSIITEYIINQHALCKHPVETCPQFNFVEPHKCPDPCKKNFSPPNVTARLTRRTLGMNSRKLDRSYIYSRFCPVKTFRPQTGEVFTCCTFLPCMQYLLLGTNDGRIKMFNIHTGIEEASYMINYRCPSIYHTECNKRGNLLLISAGDLFYTHTNCMSGLWDIGSFSNCKIKFDFKNEEYVEFSKLQDKIIGTQGKDATIYDIATAKLLLTLSPSISNQYINNRATFDMNDKLVLSDGVLWDVNSCKTIHKFDKWNQRLNGVFHPNGTEIVSNTEIWDLRTFHLLKTVPTLDEMEVIFSPVNNIIYALYQRDKTDLRYKTSFKTLDSFDYSDIATYNGRIRIKNGISGFACNKFDTQIATVVYKSKCWYQEYSSVKLYDVGRRKDVIDEVDEDDDDDDDDDDDNDEDKDEDEDGDGFFLDIFASDASESSIGSASDA